MGAPILVLVKCWKRLKCSFASAVWPERCNARANCKLRRGVQRVDLQRLAGRSQSPCRTASSPGSRRPRNKWNPHPWDRASPPAESSPAPAPDRCPRAGKAQVVPRLRAVWLQRDGLSASAFLASSSFCSAISAMPSLIAACASFGSFLKASANDAAARSVNCWLICATPRLFSRTASASKRACAPSRCRSRYKKSKAQRPGHPHSSLPQRGWNSLNQNAA